MVGCSNCGGSDFVWAGRVRSGLTGAGRLALRGRGEAEFGTRICRTCGHADLFVRDLALVRSPHRWKPGEFGPVPDEIAPRRPMATPPATAPIPSTPVAPVETPPAAPAVRPIPPAPPIPSTEPRPAPPPTPMAVAAAPTREARSDGPVPEPTPVAPATPVSAFGALPPIPPPPSPPSAPDEADSAETPSAPASTRKAPSKGRSRRTKSPGSS